MMNTEYQVYSTPIPTTYIPPYSGFDLPSPPSPYYNDDGPKYQPILQNKLKKCLTLKDLLVDNWQVKIYKSQFISLLDSHKVAFKIGVQDLNKILQCSVFSESERKRIKKLRYQGRNNEAAKTLRIKNKKRETELHVSLSELEQTRVDLRKEKERLKQEINYYQSALTNQFDFSN